MDEEMKKDETVTEAEVEEIKDEEIKEEKEEVEEPSEEDVAKKKKREFYFELALFLVLGILIGIAVKTEAAKRITIGYDDYKMKIKKQDYNVGALQAEINKASEEAANEAQENIPEGEEISPEDAQDETVPAEGEIAPEGGAQSNAETQ